MIELFSRVLGKITFNPPGYITSIPIDERVASLLAILLDDDDYQFVLEGRLQQHGFPSWIGEDRLIPLKAVAWMEMNERVSRGKNISSKNIRKHLVDIIKLAVLFEESLEVASTLKIKSDLKKFLQSVSSTFQPKLSIWGISLAKPIPIAWQWLFG